MVVNHVAGYSSMLLRYGKHRKVRVVFFIADLRKNSISEAGFPFPRFLKLRKAQARCGLACAGEKLLHQALFVGFEGVEFLGLSRYQRIE